MRPDAVRAVISFLKRLVFAEFLVGAAYMALADLGYYAQIYRKLSLNDLVSFQIAHTIFLFMAQGVLIGAAFWWWRRNLRIEPHPQELALQSEHERLERKSTLRWDLVAGKINKSLEHAVMKTIAAFLNTDGGHLLLGIGDDGSAVGLAHDYATLARKDADGLTNHFGNLFNAMIGAHVRHLVRAKPFTHEGKECMLVSVSCSPRPVYLKDEGREEFFIRTGNGTTSLKLSQAQAYIDARWKGKM